jgi:hypothetical protein
MPHHEVEAILTLDDDYAVSTVRSTLLLWTFGLFIILGNLIFNPLWEGPWYAKLWLPAIFIGALVLLLVSKYNRRTEFGKIVFERGWIRISPKGTDKEVYRIAEITDLDIKPGIPGFFRNPLKKGTAGSLRFKNKGELKEYQFRLRKHEDVDILQQIIDVNIS